MTWVRIDDSMPENPVMAGLSDAAFRAWVESLCYCSRNLTDGYVPGRIAAQRWSPKAVDELVTAGRWEALEHGFGVHDYLEFNPTRAHVEETRQKKRRAGRLGGVATATARAAQDADDTPAVRTDVIELDPDLGILLSRLWARFPAFGPQQFPALQVRALAAKYGIERLVAILRELHGFPPDRVDSAAGLIEAIARRQIAEEVTAG